MGTSQHSAGGGETHRLIRWFAENVKKIGADGDAARHGWLRTPPKSEQVALS
jgi:hypothetical protein